jgi:primosomal protein N'
MTRPLLEGLDYTVENGKMVFTASFLLRRGFCCNSGCRNCPWRAAAPAAAPVRIVGLPGKKADDER